MNIEAQERIRAFARLGTSLKTELESGLFDGEIYKAYQENQWFTPENIRAAIQAVIENYLDKEKMISWLGPYELSLVRPKIIGIVMAGNIPLVGLHDLMAVLLSGHKAMVKLSSKDKVLPELMIRRLIEVSPVLRDRIAIVDQLKNFDAVIATGSNNTARYFEYYFSKYPRIIRKNRSSVAVLTGKESREELYDLGFDIFSYFGLGCRNVSKIYVPEHSNFNAFYSAIEPFSYVGDHHKYRNNYDYYKSIYLLNKELFFDNGFLMLKQDEALASAVSIVLFEHYRDVKLLNEQLEARREEIQCVISSEKGVNNAIPFGTTQSPQLWDYADKVDTMRFLVEL